jgi:hypothetical protein
MTIETRLADGSQFTTTWTLLCAAEALAIRHIEVWSSIHDVATDHTLFVSPI